MAVPDWLPRFRGERTDLPDPVRSRRRSARGADRLRRLAAAVLVAVAVAVVLTRLPVLRDRVPTDAVAVVATTRTIGPGQVLAAEDIALVTVPAERRPENAITDPAAITGRSAVARIERGEVLTTQRLVGDAALRAATDGGRVVIAVPVIDPEVLGYAPAGTRVDLLGGSGGTSATGALVLSTPPSAGDPAVGGLLTSASAGSGPRSVLLAVTAAEAARIARELTQPTADGSSAQVSGYLVAVRPT